MADKENYPVKLSWKQLWTIIIIGLGIVGSIFTAGMKVQGEINKVEVAKLTQKNLEEVAYLKMSLSRQLMEANENLSFYQNQYRTVKARLNICIEKGTYIEGNAAEE